MMTRKDRLKNAVLLESARRTTKKGGLRGAWDDIITTFKMVGAWLSGSYTKVPLRSIAMIGLGALYFFSPIDLIPDFLLGLGLIDDVVVISLVIKTIKTDLDDYRVWKATRDAVLHENKPVIKA